MFANPANFSSTVDVHAHLIHVDETKLKAIADVECVEDGTLMVDGHGIKLKALYEPLSLINWMDQHGIKLALISAPPPFYRQHLTEQQAGNWVSYLNDGLQTIAANTRKELKCSHICPWNTHNWRWPKPANDWAMIMPDFLWQPAGALKLIIQTRTCARCGNNYMIQTALLLYTRAVVVIPD